MTCSCLIDHRHLERKWRPLASVIGHVRTRVGLFLRRHGLENPVLHLECGASDRSVLSLSLSLSLSLRCAGEGGKRGGWRSRMSFSLHRLSMWIFVDRRRSVSVGRGDSTPLRLVRRNSNRVSDRRSSTGRNKTGEPYVWFRFFFFTMKTKKSDSLPQTRRGV